MSEPLTRPIRAGQIGATARSETIVATQAERAALAKLFGLPGIVRLEGAFTLRGETGGVIAARLHLTARLTQICVVTLDPFEADIVEESDLRFIPAESLGEAVDLAELDEATLDAPDELPYANDRIDLGVALAEQLALALDPYPRKPGAEFVDDAGQDAHPFAALAARLKPDG